MVAAARAEGATDLEIHDAVLIAAAFCMYNRYVDGLGTLAPDGPELRAEGQAHRRTQLRRLTGTTRTETALIVRDFELFTDPGSSLDGRDSVALSVRRAVRLDLGSE